MTATPRHSDAEAGNEMVRIESPSEFCHAHSGFSVWMKLGGAVVGGLLLIMSAILGIMRNDQKEMDRRMVEGIEGLRKEIRCLAPISDTGELRTMIQSIRDEQIRLKTIVDERTKADLLRHSPEKVH